jgi:hypothetical protein
MDNELTVEERTELFRWEQRVLRIAAAAVLALGLVVLVPIFIVVPRWLWLGLFTTGVVLALMSLYLLITGKCPRCGSMISLQSFFIVPDACKGCGLKFTRPSHLEAELDN